ncbi:BREX-2 system phosphatase PglZ [Candidatus Laterigemmans baculatus]|uniref:BREX-2 system phosphatase PglZ n=1 Tax=Candidatus Laterigemmans baculatus TaxID=2770505 RepID=UPI0013D9C626|nr:BREX-2 system phosphatase PglZ [Candidatus Laterigemmans baculatus]
MAVAAPSFHEIKAQVRAIRQALERSDRTDDAQVVGIHTNGRWAGDAERTDGDERYWIVQCDSPLAMRLALQETRPDVTTKVLLTQLSDTDLEMDVLLRLAKRRLFTIDAWQIVQSLFQARSLDPRIARHAWMAEKLLDSMPAEGYPPSPSGFLDAETVWQILLERELGLSADQPDLAALLAWSVHGENVDRWRATSTEFRKAAIDWISQTAGPAATAILTMLTRSEKADAVAIGLALGVVFHKSAKGKLDKPAVRLEERYLGGQSLEENVISRWHSTASEVVTVHFGSRPKLRYSLLERCDEILADVEADQFAWLSRTSPRGFNLRMARYGKALRQTLKSSPVVVSEHLVELKEAISDHDLARDENHRRRLERVEMSLRLVRWLMHVSRSGPPEHASLAEAAEWHLAEGSFVDWARLTLRSGDLERDLSKAYGELIAAANKLREPQARRFAELARDWTAAGSTGGGVIPVERVLEQLVGPLAADFPVLLMVLDGMSGAVCRELLSSITRSNDWTVLCKTDAATLQPALATIPSVTKVSRTSLLTGQLQQGDQAAEQKGFAQHPALVKQCGRTKPPVLFHKVDLADADGPDAVDDLRDEIASTGRKVVGVVINAIDDTLAKGDQLDIRWSRDQIKILPMLLHEAHTAGRLVIFVSDHGHVLEHRTEYRSHNLDAPQNSGERWRPNDGQPQEGELLVSGSRVMLADDQQVIVPWSETIRYTRGKSNGYHGGLSPQEMIAPIAVLSPSEKVPEGWALAPLDTPAWWDDAVAEMATVESAEPAELPEPTKPGLLFDLEPAENTAMPAASTAKAQPQWIESLLASPVLEQQKQLAGRIKPTDEQISSLLAALESAGGKLTTTALARRLELPPVRLPGFLAMMQRMLNIEGYAVLTRDDASDTVELNQDLLRRQFELE